MRNKRPNLIQVPLNLIWAVLLSALTGVVGAAPLKALRNALNPVVYPVLIAITTATLFFIGSPYLATVVAAHGLMIGLYAEFEEHGMSVLQSAGSAVTVTIALLTGASYIFLSFRGPATLTAISADIEVLIQQVQSIRPELVGLISLDAILPLAPAIVIIFLIFSMAAGIIFERPFARWIGVKPTRREKLADFVLPDYFIWALIVSLLFSNVDLAWPTSKVISANVLYVCMSAYFLQGLAVLFKAFDIFKVGILSKIIFVFLFAVQFQVVLAVIGVADYWADFRKMFSKRIAQAKKQV